MTTTTLPSTTIDPRIFRAYDVRGRAHEQLTEHACRMIAHAFGTELRERYKVNSPRVALGRDARTHGPELERATLEGLLAAGCTVLTIGPTPSPVNYFTIATQQLDGGIHVTASHNPGHDNGLKISIRDAEGFSGEHIQGLRLRIEEGRLAMGEGRVEPFDAITPYLARIGGMFGKVAAGMKVVVDGGNGIGGPAYCAVLRNAGAEVIELYTEPDGRFPNHPADPSKWETLKDLQALVVAEQADIGLAFDGDGDRLGVVDETGQIRTSDEIILLLAKDHLSRHPGAPIVYTVSNSAMLKQQITVWGGKPVMGKVGHTNVEHTMREHGALLGGELSGHLFCFEDYLHFDDAVVAGLRVLSILKHSSQPLSQLFAAFPKVYKAPEKRPTVPDDRKVELVDTVTRHFQTQGHEVHTLDGMRIEFEDGSWAGVRYSNTSPCISICIEAASPERLVELEEMVMGHLRGYSEIEWH